MNRIDKAREFLKNGKWAKADSDLAGLMADYAESAVREFIERTETATGGPSYAMRREFREMFGKDLDTADRLRSETK